jgi:hypothetical protein
VTGRSTRRVACVGGCGKKLPTKGDNSRRRCKPCRRRQRREWYAANKGRLDTGKWAREHPAQRRAYIAAWRAKHPGKNAKYDRAYKKRLKEMTDAVLVELEAACTCGVVHDAGQRERVLRRMLPATAHEIREAWSCIWGLPDEKGAGARRFYRDLEKLGAVWQGGTFYLSTARAAA